MAFSMAHSGKQLRVLREGNMHTHAHTWVLNVKFIFVTCLRSPGESGRKQDPSL